MRKVLALLLVIFGLLATVPAWKAMQVADRWVQFLNFERGRNVLVAFERRGIGIFAPRELQFQVMRLNEVYYKGEKVGYIAILYPSGYILIPNTEIVSPVKFYSTSGEFDPGKNGFHRDLLEYLYIALKAEERTPLIKGAPTWDFLVSANPATIKAMAEEEATFGPIVTTRWNQSWPYNKYTPVVNGYHTPTGCVATAYAQILKFWNWPNRGKGSYSYYWSTGGKTLTANFDHPYYWDRMPDKLDSNSTDAEIDAVARLMYDIGVAVEMDYAPGGSGAYPWLAIENFPKFFKYSKDMTYIIRCNAFQGDNCLPGHLKSAAQWVGEIRSYIDRFEPIEFSMFGKSGNNYSGHAVVVDGYKITGTQRFIHINMGWGGSSDGFYSVDNILNFNLPSWEYAIVNIYPDNPPPKALNVKAVRHTDRGLFVHRYMDEITWDPPSEGENGISKYQVIRWAVDSGFVDVVEEVPVGQERKVVVNVGTRDLEYKYAIVSVAPDGKRGHPTSFVSVERK